MNPRFTLFEYPDPKALARAAAARWLDATAPTFRSVALSGGRIAREFLSAAADIAVADPMVNRKLQQTHFFWADERCVSPEHAESNYRLARESMFDRLGSTPPHLHRLKGEEEPSRAAEEATAQLLRTVPLNSEGTPIVDLALLGMGEDGHVASLFPGGEGLFASTPYIVVAGPKPPNPRLTLTFPVLAAAVHCWVLVTGEQKGEALRNSLTGNNSTPLHQLIRLRPHTLLFVDRNILNSIEPGKVETLANSVGAVR